MICLKGLFDFREDNTRSCSDYEEFKQLIEEKRGFLFLPGVAIPSVKKNKNDTKATIRCLPFGLKPESDKCLACGEKEAVDSIGILCPGLLSEVNE
jgi:prolyl-tRNA synthetase